MNEVTAIQPLSEQEIKDIMLRFLKRHYRNRQRNGETEIASDARGKGGILADGYLSFPKPGGGWFVATFEATSYDTRQEVRFTQRRGLLFWDNMVAALWGTAIGGGFNITQQWLPIKKYGPALPLVMLISVFTGLFFLVRMLSSHWRRYRQIYAVEQFKRYHTDEQWIAVAEEVFNGPHDPHFIELRRQCIRYGFGLVVIAANEAPRAHLTPAREDVFEGRRDIVKLITDNELVKNMQNLGRQAWITELWGKMSAYIPQSDQWLHRFGGRLPKHWLASAVAFVFIIAIWYHDYDTWAHRKVTPKVYAEEAIQALRALPPEPSTINLDTPYFWPAPFLDDRISYLDEWLEDRLIAQRLFRNSARNAAAREDGYGVIFYDCARFLNFEGVKFLLLDGVYSDFESSLLRVEMLQADGIQAGSLWLGCFDERSKEYAVYLGPLFNTPGEAGRLARELEYLRSDRSSRDFLTVKAIKADASNRR
ncbi:MAG TPA: hypothetical protein PLZ12_18655 [Saprospiraceae bacterium]|nr:hypothetical protein [Saprospiraceae bacterium]